MLEICNIGITMWESQDHVEWEHGSGHVSIAHADKLEGEKPSVCAIDWILPAGGYCQPVEVARVRGV